MKITDLFLRRPVLALVVNLIIIIAGLQAIRSISVRQYPRSENAAVTVTTVYVGANASLVRGFVTTPLERAIAAADGIEYMESKSTLGLSTITVRLKLNYDSTKALAEISSKVDQVRRDLPPEAEVPVINIESADSQFASAYLSFSSDMLKQNEITDYLVRVVQPRLSAIQGVQRADILGARTFAMRVWLKPEQMAAFNLSPTQIRDALAANNFLAALGHSKGAYIQVNLTADTNLSTVEEFQRLVVLQKNDTIVRLGDVADVVLGAEDYDAEVRFSGQTAVFIGIWPLPNANSLDVIKRVRAEMASIQKDLPTGLVARVAYDATDYISNAITEVLKTLGDTLLIVMVVIFLFLGSFRSVLIPVVAIPLSLIGGVFLMQAFGFTLNLLTLLAIVLSVGLVVDDAIVVVENVERVMREEGLSPLEATRKSMGQIQGALIGIGVVLSAVLLPMAFFGGSTGVIYRQFSITIVSAMVLSVLMALIFTPALCATLLKPIDKDDHHEKRGFFGWFNRTFERSVNGYERGVKAVLKRKAPFLLLYVLIVAVMVVLFNRIPTAFLPEEDQGVLFAQVMTPSGSTAERTQQSIDAMRSYLLEEEGDIVRSVFTVTGFSFAGRGQSSGIAFIGLKPWSERTNKDDSVFALAQRAQQHFASFRDAQVFAFAPPAVMELGNATGFNFFLQDRAGVGQEVLQQARDKFLQLASQSPVLTRVRPNTLRDEPQYQVLIDDEKARVLGVSLADINSTLSIAWGGRYVNDFIDRGRVKKVYLQGVSSARMNPEDLQKWYVRNADGEMVPFSAFATGEWTYGSPKLSRYNGVSAIEMLGEPAPGYSSGDAMAEVERIAAQLPPGVGYSWTGQSYEERLAGSQTLALYALSLLVVFLCLAALYESWSIPFSVMLVVPLGIVGALAFTLLRGLSNEVFFQVGLVTTIGLSARNAILIVEFAKALHEQGMSYADAALQACRMRLRPIIMTSLAFILGVVPLAIASGAGAGSKHAIGTGVIGGMLTAAVLAIFWIPLFYVMICTFFDRTTSANQAAKEESL